MVRKTPLGEQICLVDNDGIVELKMEEKNDNEIEEVITITMDSWNPFNSVKVPKGYCFFGKFAFLCYGPASEYFSEMLSSKGSQVTTLVDKKKMGRAAMLKETSAQANVNRDVGKSDRGMSHATKASFRFMAQNEDDAVQRHHDMC